MAFQLKIDRTGVTLTTGKAAPQQVSNPVTTTYATDGIFAYNQLWSSSIIELLSISTDRDIVKAITDCPLVSAIMYRRMQAFANGKIEVLQASNENEVRGQNKKWQRLVDKPNIKQSGNQFFSQIEFYTLGFGYCPVLMVKAAGFDDVASMWVLPPSLCDIKWKKVLPFYVTKFNDLIESFKIKGTDGKWYNLPIEDIFIFKDSTEERSDCPLPESRVRKNAPVIDTAIKNYQSRARLISKPYGILSNQAKDSISTLPMDPDEINKVQNQFSQYGTEKGKWDMVITNSTLQFIPMMPPIAQLQLLELLKSDAAVLCDGLEYEYDLLSRDLGGVALNNKNEANKLLYQNFIIPKSDSIMQQLGQMLSAEENRVLYNISYSHLPVFQVDEKFAAETRSIKAKDAIYEFERNVITHDRMMQLIGEEVVPEFKGLYYHQMPHVLEAQEREDAKANNQNISTNEN